MSRPMASRHSISSPVLLRLAAVALAIGLVPLLTRCLKTREDTACGNAIVEAEEECDCGTGASPNPSGCVGPNRNTGTSSCRSNCRLPRCGDGIMDERPGETCDDGNADLNDACPSGPEGNCQAARCGDGFLFDADHGGPEACDDGNAEDRDACPSGPRGDCQAPARCGDGILWAGVEVCDGSDFGPLSCTALGFAGGPLTCDASCLVGLDGCVE